MTFLATYDGELQPGNVDGQPRTIERDGATVYDWPQPWGFRCDTCGRDFPYRCVALKDSQKLEPATVRKIGDDQHRCAYCEGHVDPEPAPEPQPVRERDVQLGLFDQAAAA